MLKFIIKFKLKQNNKTITINNQKLYLNLLQIEIVQFLFNKNFINTNNYLYVCIYIINKKYIYIKINYNNLYILIYILYSYI